jgi:hypothetical protein
MEQFSVVACTGVPAAHLAPEMAFHSEMPRASLTSLSTAASS